MYIDTMLLFDLNVTGVHRIKTNIMNKHYIPLRQNLYLGSGIKKTAQ